MALKIIGRDITNFDCCGGVRGLVTIAGKTFVCKELPKWETVWSGSQAFTESGSFTISGLAAGDEATFSATVNFVADIYDENKGGWNRYYATVTATDESLPYTMTNGYADVNISRNGNVLDFAFVPYEEEYKGMIIRTKPETLTFTNVKKKV